MIIRQPEFQEHDCVRALIKTVADETFAELFAPRSVPLNFEGDDFSLAWIAVSNAKIVGVVLTHQEWIRDLWVLRGSRRQGVGGRLLMQGENEIANRGYRRFRLRVVKFNTVAVQFYLHHGWRIAREFAHEKYQHTMLEMVKLHLADDSPINRSKEI